MNQDIKIYTSNEPIGANSIEYKGFVIVNKVKSRNVFSTMGAAFKTLPGGEMRGMTKLTNETRNELLTEIKDQAQLLGANCILAIRLETNDIMQGMLDIVIYGTAVYCEWAE